MQRVTGEGPSYREQQKWRIQCRKFREEMASGSMTGHMKTQHGRAAEEIYICTTLATGEEPRTYHMA